MNRSSPARIRHVGAACSCSEAAARLRATRFKSSRHGWTEESEIQIFCVVTRTDPAIFSSRVRMVPAGATENRWQLKGEEHSPSEMMEVGVAPKENPEVKELP